MLSVQDSCDALSLRSWSKSANSADNPRIHGNPGLKLLSGFSRLIVSLDQCPRIVTVSIMFKGTKALSKGLYPCLYSPISLATNMPHLLSLFLAVYQGLGK